MYTISNNVRAPSVALPRRCLFYDCLQMHKVYERKTISPIIALANTTHLVANTYNHMILTNHRQMPVQRFADLSNGFGENSHFRYAYSK